MWMRTVAGGLFAFVCSCFVVAPALASGPIVVTPSGAIEGVTTPSGREWRGIPYAAAPIGALRFRPPARAGSWSGVRDAASFGSPCLQPSDFASDGSVASTLGSEDCLFLNVFAPLASTGSSHLPVMVHLHGGSNTFGSGYEDASAFIARGVIVVTLNYRLGALGFVGHPALSAEGAGSSGEYGVLDQLAALRWVHDNISAFGGDPANVTLFGLSAGSFDTVALMASPLAAGLLTRAAVQGDVYWGLTGYNTQIADAESIGSGLANDLGCGGATNVPACLRALPADQIVRKEGAMDFVPWVGGIVLPRSPLELIAGRLQGIPLLVGFDREEDSIFEWQYLADPFTNANWVHTTTLLVGPPLATKARALYPPSQYESSKWAYIAMATDAKRGCPTRRLANANVAHAATYRYLYTHVLENDPFHAQFKATHATEDIFLWGDSSFYTPTPSEQLLSQRMTDYWTNFAKSGNPNGSGLPSWPQYDLANEPIALLDNPIGLNHGYHAEQCALLDTSPPFSFDPAFSHGRKNGLFDFLP
jgi:para-nitrobenzyl esterase